MGIFDDLMAATDEPDTIEGLREQIVSWIVPGFEDRSDVIRSATEYLEDEELLTDRQVEQLVDELWNARLAEQQTWPERTPFRSRGTAPPRSGSRSDR